MNGCSEWKNFVNSKISGGIDSRKHPLFIADAMKHAECHFTGKDVPYGTTEVFKLGKAIYPMVASAVEEAKRKLNSYKKSHHP